MQRSDIEAALADFFDPAEVKWKPATVSGNRALALAYVDARVIQDRLDEVMGITGWKDHYMVIGEDSVKCSLSIRVGEEWITKEDVGSLSEQPDDGDKMKAAFSDALKRAAVKFGIGRYLYRLPSQWVDYDPTKKRFASTPQLPAVFKPKARPDGRAEKAREDGLKILRTALAQGRDAMNLAWKALAPAMREACKGDLDALKAEVAKVEAQRQRQPGEDETTMEVAHASTD